MDVSDASFTNGGLVARRRVPSFRAPFRFSSRPGPSWSCTEAAKMTHPLFTGAPSSQRNC